MQYLTAGWFVVYPLAALWLLGWVNMAHAVELEHSDKTWKKVGSYAILFFVWPYVAYCIARQGDI